MSQAVGVDHRRSPVDTKRAKRRSLEFSDLESVLADLDAIEASLDAGTLEASGNWTPGQIFDHLGRFVAYSLDGLPAIVPAPVRWVMRLLLKRRAVESSAPIPAGLKLRWQATVLLPDSGVDDRRALAFLRQQLARIVEGGDRMNQPSPLFGPMTHEQWLVLQRKHLALHLSFLHPNTRENA